MKLLRDHKIYRAALVGAIALFILCLLIGHLMTQAIHKRPEIPVVAAMVSEYPEVRSLVGIVKSVELLDPRTSVINGEDFTGGSFHFRIIGTSKTAEILVIWRQDKTDQHPTIDRIDEVNGYYLTTIWRNRFPKPLPY
jgi:hypothetical protein